MVRPGELNLMTAGRGIAHSEVSTPATTVLHGVQLWTALPARARHMPPAFDHYAPTPVQIPGGVLRVFLGTLAGLHLTDRHGHAAARLQFLDGALTLPVDASFEHGVLVDAGPVEVDGVAVERGSPPTSRPAPSGSPCGPSPPTARVVLLGGPFGEPIVMWWNFLGGSHDEIVDARTDWEAELAAAGTPPAAEEGVSSRERASPNTLSRDGTPRSTRDSPVRPPSDGGCRQRPRAPGALPLVWPGTRLLPRP